jgi:hypothetical protein
MEPIKVTEQELNQVKQLQDKYTEIVARLGQIQLDKLKLEQMESELKENFKQLQKDEESIVTEMNTKYGPGQLNVESGLFTAVQ